MSRYGPDLVDYCVPGWLHERFMECERDEAEQPPEHGLRAVAASFWPEMVPRRTEGTERYPMESTRYAPVG